MKASWACVGLSVALAVLGLAPAAAWAQGPENILVVVNGLSPDSVQIGDYYVRKRRVPPANLLRIEVAADEQVARPVYEQQIEQPIAAWLGRNGAHDRILYIVLTKGVPIRIAGTPGHTGTIASVDSELTLLYRRLTGRSTAPQGHLPNPYFLGDRPIAEAKPFTHETLDIFLVTRLDAFTLAEVIGLIDRGGAAVKTGRVALDERASVLTDPGNRWLERTADVLRQMGQGDRVLLDTTWQVLNGQQDLLGYYSWGSNDPAIKDRDQKLTFVTGALAAAYVSTDGRTFKEPPASWTLGTWGDRSTHFAGSPQSLAGDLIRHGITGVAGHVAEPYLDATIRPDVLFPAYISGFNLVFRYFAYALMLLVLGVSLFVGPLLTILATKAYMDAAPLVPIICLSFVFFSLDDHFRVPALLAKKTMSLIPGNAIGAATNILLNLMLVPIFGAVAAAWVSVVTYATFAGVNLMLCRRIDKFDYPLGRCALVLGGMIVTFVICERMPILNNGDPISLALRLAVWAAWAGSLSFPLWKQLNWPWRVAVQP